MGMLLAMFIKAASLFSFLTVDVSTSNVALQDLYAVLCTGLEGPDLLDNATSDFLLLAPAYFNQHIPFHPIQLFSLNTKSSNLADVTKTSRVRRTTKSTKVRSRLLHTFYYRIRTASQETMAPIRVGLMGYGFSTKCFHLPFILPNQDLEVYAFLQRKEAPKDTSNIEAGVHCTVDHPKAKHYRTADDFFADAAIELVIICTGHDSHYELAEKALLAGKHRMRISFGKMRCNG